MGSEEIINSLSEQDIRKAIVCYSENRAQYKNNEKHAYYFLLDCTSDTVYSLKVIIALAYLIAKGNNCPTKGDYDSFKVEKGFKGTEENAELMKKKLKQWRPESQFQVKDKKKDKNEIDEYIRLSEDEINRIDNEASSFVGEEKNIICKQRINQGRFRKQMLSCYSRCAICGMDHKELLIVSHIVPWSKCDSFPEDRTNVNNALMLCPNHDRLFDRYLITFDDDGKIIISKSLVGANRKLLNISEKDCLNVRMSDERKKFMKKHRQHFNELADSDVGIE